MGATGAAGVRVQQVSTAEELQAFKAMTLSYLEWLAEDLCFQGIEEELAGLPGCYATSAGGCMLLAFDDAGNSGAPCCIGAVALRALAGKHAGGGSEVAGVDIAAVCEMKRLFVLPEYHGRGTGSALVEAVLGEARRLGYRAMVLDTLDRLQAANRLYRAQGFELCQPYNHCPLPGVLYFLRKLG